MTAEKRPPKPPSLREVLSALRSAFRAPLPPAPPEAVREVVS